MTRRFIGVRWWLGAAFALVAAVSTAIVVAQFSSRSENAFRSHAEQLAAGSAYLAAAGVEDADRHGVLATRLQSVAQHFALDLFVYGRDGRLLQTLVSDENASISAAAMALILARGRRPPELQRLRLYWSTPHSMLACLNAGVHTRGRRLVFVCDSAPEPGGLAVGEVVHASANTNSLVHARSEMEVNAHHGPAWSEREH